MLYKKQQELIDLLFSQVQDLTMMSKIELGDDVIAEIKSLRSQIERLQDVPKNSMKVEIYLKETSQRIKYKDAQNTYTKGPFYCVLTKDGWVYKYPISNIFNIRESY